MFKKVKWVALKNSHAGGTAKVSTSMKFDFSFMMHTLTMERIFKGIKGSENVSNGKNRPAETDEPPKLGQ